MFMVEKAVRNDDPFPEVRAVWLTMNQYIIRSSNKKPRMKSKLYLFNSFGMIGRQDPASPHPGLC